MARFSRLLVGGAIGAGLAFLLSRKDVRRRLMGQGQPQLPAAYEPERGAAAETAAAPVDLESRLEESRRRIETGLEEPFTAAVATMEEAETEIAETAIGEPAIAAPVEEEMSPAVEEEGPVEVIETVETLSEFVADETGGEVEVTLAEETMVIEEKPEETIVEEEAAISPEETVEETRIDETPLSARAMPVEYDSPAYDPFTSKPAPVESETVEYVEETAPEEPEPAEAAAEDVSDDSGFAALSAPATGEPTIEETETTAEAGETGEVTAKPEPSGLDRDEMKRRIDETRARLKAKAFDAMVSGETFVTPDTGEPMKADEPGVEIDEETGEQIDRSLKEED